MHLPFKEYFMEEQITVLIADDHTLFRETLRVFINLDNRFKVIAECDTAEQAIEVAQQTLPQVILMDINFQGMNGILATQTIHKKCPDIKILGISVHNQPDYAKRMIKYGASGYITKGASTAELFHAMIELKKGNTYVGKEVKDILAEQVTGQEDPSEGYDSLSIREKEVVHLIAEGYTPNKIAEKLSIQPKTVEVHRYNSIKKLNLKSTKALIQFLKKEKPL